MDLSTFGSALSNPTRVELLSLLSDTSGTASDLADRYNERYDDTKHRESIYRELEKLVEVGLLDKEYDTEARELQYSLSIVEYRVNLASSEVVVEES